MTIKPIEPIVPKEGEVFFIFGIDPFTVRALRDELQNANLDTEPVPKICPKRGKVMVFETPSSFVDYIIANPVWTSHRYVIYHEIDDVFSAWQPEKGQRRPPMKQGGNEIPMSKFATAKKSRGRNV